MDKYNFGISILSNLNFLYSTKFRFKSPWSSDTFIIEHHLTFSDISSFRFSLIASLNKICYFHSKSGHSTFYGISPKFHYPKGLTLLRNGIFLTRFKLFKMIFFQVEINSGSVSCSKLVYLSLIKWFNCIISIPKPRHYTASKPQIDERIVRRRSNLVVLSFLLWTFVCFIIIFINFFPLWTSEMLLREINKSIQPLSFFF